MRVAVVSVYMSNLPRWVIDAQDQVVCRFLPRDHHVVWTQLHAQGRHGEALDAFIKSSDADIFVIFDIDAIPLSETAIPYLIHRAQHGALVGIIQRSNHIENGRHVYVAPSVMAFSRDTYQRIGQPSFLETDRGDVGEELTYLAEAGGIEVERLRPHEVLSAKQWALDGSDEPQYGNATVYAVDAQPAFYHQFQIRLAAQQPRFVAACRATFAGRVLDAPALDEPGREPMPKVIQVPQGASHLQAWRHAYESKQAHTLILTKHMSARWHAVLEQKWPTLARTLPAHYGVLSVAFNAWFPDWLQRPRPLLEPQDNRAFVAYVVERTALPLLAETLAEQQPNAALVKAAMAKDPRVTGPWMTRLSAAS